jgi:predicted AAA+ superfamily ATPase
LVRACLAEYAAQGLRVIEVEKDHLHDLPLIVDLIRHRPERFIVFCDDLSFETQDTGYKSLKTVLDGSFNGYAENVLVYATSNRRHLLPEYDSDNVGYSHPSDHELHPSETVEEKIALSERFGLWLSFYPFKQDDYLSIVSDALKRWGWVAQNDEDALAMRTAALQFTIERGSRSARVAQHFARQWAGQAALEKTIKASS